MIGSPLIAAWTAHLAFWGLLLYGWVFEQLTLKRIALFLLIWLAGRIGLPLLPGVVGAMFPSFVAVLDIILVFTIFKGDVRLT